VQKLKDNINDALGNDRTRLWIGGAAGFGATQQYMSESAIG